MESEKSKRKAILRIRDQKRPSAERKIRQLKQNIHIGTSGWHYKHWKGPYYPEKMKSQDFLDFYIKDFHTVELNNSFYRLPEKSTFEAWRKATPKNFMFAVKASRYITHIKKLKDPQEIFGNFIERASALKEKLGPILFQLPPSWKINMERLEEFLKVLPRTFRYTFEFRNDTWFSQEVYELLKKYNVALCIYELNRNLSPKVVTADFVYVRLHGPGKAYQGQYKGTTLKDWTQDFKKWHKEGKEIWCFFDNDEKGYAAADAKRLKRMMKGKGSRKEREEMHKEREERK